MNSETSILRRRDSAQATVREHRRDRGSLKKPYRTAQGFLLAEGIGACAGIHEYLIRDRAGKARIVRELIDDEVLRKDAGQIGRLPLTLSHPEEDVSPKNIAALGVGDVGERVAFIEDAQGGYVQLTICARREDAISSIEDESAAELSFGYDVMVEKKGGVHPRYGRYDQKQVKRIYNHLALVDMARHGPDARVRVDSGEDLPEGFVPLQVSTERLDMLAAVPTTPKTPPLIPGRGGSMEFLRALGAQLKIARWDSLTEDGLKAAIKDKGEELVRVADSVEAARGERKDMRASELVADMVASHSKAKADMEKASSKKIADLSAELKEAQDELAAFKAKSKEEEDAAKDAADKARTDAADFTTKLEAATSRADAAEAKATEAEAKVATLEATVTELQGKVDAAKAAEDAAEAEAKKVADAAELASLTKLAEEIKVDVEDDGKAKDLATLRKDCAGAIYGSDIESFSEDAIAGILAAPLRRMADGKSAIATEADPRYRAPKNRNDGGTPTPRPSLRSRANELHNGGSK